MDTLDLKIRAYLVEQGYLFPITDSEIEYSLNQFKMQETIQQLHNNAEQYRKQAQEADNDILAFALYEKANREYRMIDFLQSTLPKIKELKTAKIIKQDLVQGLFIVEFDGIGIVDIYPKKPSAKVRKPQRWHQFKDYKKFINKITTT